MRPAVFVASMLWGLWSLGCDTNATVVNQSAGSIGGEAFSVPYAVVGYGSDPQDTSVPALLVFLSSSSDICALLQSSHLPKNSTLVQLLLQSVQNGNVGLPSGVGTYQVTLSQTTGAPADGNYALFGVGRLSASDTCFSGPNVLSAASSGRVVVTDIGSRSRAMQAAYNVVIDSNNILQGTLTAEPCIIEESVWTSDEPPVCE